MFADKGDDVAHSLSAKKRMRQNEKRRIRNQARRTELKNSVRTVREALAGGNAADAEKALHAASVALDRGAAQGTLHRNAAARRKSRLARKLNALKKQGAGK